jgi:hypothetical protein
MKVSYDLAKKLPPAITRSRKVVSQFVKMTKVKAHVRDWRPTTVVIGSPDDL